jgi:hypothetical protein
MQCIKRTFRHQFSKSQRTSMAAHFLTVPPQLCPCRVHVGFLLVTEFGHMLKAGLQNICVCLPEQSQHFCSPRQIVNSFLLRQVQILQSWGSLSINWCENGVPFLFVANTSGMQIVSKFSESWKRSNSSASRLTDVIRGRLSKWIIVCGKLSLVLLLNS